MDKNPTVTSEREGGGRRLASSWSLWEKYQVAFIQNAANYDENLSIIFEFDTLEKFTLLWKYTTYNRPSELFYDVENSMAKKFKEYEDDNEDKIVDGLFLFRTGIQPKWEDPQNHKGCSIYIDLHNLTPSKIDRLWKGLIFGVVGENFPFSSYITGLRILDRMKKHNFIKLELWMSCGTMAHKNTTPEYARNQEIINAIKDYLHKIICNAQEVNQHDIIKKEHYIASKVN